MCRGISLQILLSVSIAVTAIDVIKTVTKCEIRVELSDGMISFVNKDELCSCLMYEKSLSATSKVSEPCKLNIVNSGGKLAFSAGNICECAGYYIGDKGKENTTASDTYVNATTPYAVTHYGSLKYKVTTTTEKPVTTLNETGVESSIPNSTDIPKLTLKTEITEFKPSEASTLFVNSTVTPTYYPSKIPTTEVFKTTNTDVPVLLKIDKVKYTITKTVASNTPKSVDEWNTTFSKSTDITPLLVTNKSSVIVTDSTKSIDGTEAVNTKTTNITNTTIIKSRRARTTAMSFPEEATSDLATVTNTTELFTTKSTDFVKIKGAGTHTAKPDTEKTTGAVSDGHIRKLLTPKTTIYFSTTEVEIKNITDVLLSTIDGHKTHLKDHRTKEDSTHITSAIDNTTLIINTTHAPGNETNDTKGHLVEEDNRAINIILIVLLAILCLVFLLIICNIAIPKYFRSGSYELPHSAERNIEMECKG